MHAAAPPLVSVADIRMLTGVRVTVGVGPPGVRVGVAVRVIVSVARGVRQPMPGVYVCVGVAVGVGVFVGVGVAVNVGVTVGVGVFVGVGVTVGVGVCVLHVPSIVSHAAPLIGVAFGPRHVVASPHAIGFAEPSVY
jgi:hypothetical protein